MKNAENEKKERTILTDMLEGLKSEWWKYLLSFVTGAAAGVATTKALDSKFAVADEPEAEEPPFEIEEPDTDILEEE